MKTLYIISKGHYWAKKDKSAKGRTTLYLDENSVWTPDRAKALVLSTANFAELTAMSCGGHVLAINPTNADYPVAV